MDDLKPFRRLTDRIAGLQVTAPAVRNIERGIPIPPKKVAERDGWMACFPWRHMSVGDSFFVPYDAKLHPMQKKLVQNKIGAMIHIVSHKNRENQARALPWRFTRRTYPDGVRVWRIR